MTEQRPSKEWFRSPKRYFLNAPKEEPGTCFVKNDDYVEAIEEIKRLQQDNIRYANAHGILMAENERLSKPAHEREGPHCSTCGCGMSAEPGALGVTPIAKCGVEDGKLSWMEMLAPGLPDGEHDLFPVPLNPNGEMQPFLGAAQPPRAE